MISTFYEDYPKKPTATWLSFNSAPPMAKPSVKPVKLSAKWKQGRPIGSTKWAKEWDIGRWGFFFPVLVKLKGFFTNSVSFGRDAHSASSSNSVSFGRDARLASSFNSAGFYLWAAHCHCACHLRAVYCHCALYLWAAHCHKSSGFPPQSPIGLGGFLLDWSLGLSPQFSTRLGGFSSTILYQVLFLYAYIPSRACVLKRKQL